MSGMRSHCALGRALRSAVFLLCVGWTAPVGAAPGWPHEASDLPADPAVVWGALPNGVRWAVMPHDDPPGRATLRLYVNAGSLHEDDDQRGLAHLLEHMAFNGTRSFPEDEMVQYFQRLGMAFGADTNAHTWWGETVYKLELPEASEAYLTDGLRLFRDYADGITNDDAEVDAERGIVLAEKLARDSVQYRAYVAELGFGFAGTLVPERLTIGTDEVLRNTPAQRLRDYYRKWYTADRLTLVVTGAVAPAAVEAMVTQLFGDLPASSAPLPEPDLGKIGERGAAAFVHRDAEAPLVTVSLGCVQPLADPADTAASRRFELARDLGEAVIRRRLAILAKAEGAPFNSGTVSHYDWLGFARVAEVGLACPPEKWAEALRVAETELRRALEFGFAAGELDEARANFLEAYRNAAATAPTRKNDELADALVESLEGGEVFTSPAWEYEWAQEAVPAVTAEEALAALRAHWPAHTRLVAVSGNVGAGVDEAAVLAALAAAGREAVAAPVEEATKPWAYADFGPAGAVAETRDVADLGLRQLRFANGAQANFKATDFEENVIRVLVRFGHGQLSLPKERPELAVLAGVFVQAGGLVEHSLDDLTRLLAGRTVGFSFDVGEDAFTFSAATTPEDLELQLQLLCAALTSPGWRAEGERLAAKQVQPLYQQLRSTLDGVQADTLERLLASGDPRFGYPTEAAVAAVDTAAVRAWLEPALLGAPVEVNVVGDFDPAVLEGLLARTFGALPPRGDYAPAPATARVLRFPAGRDPVRLTYASEIEQALAAVHWPTIDSRDIQLARRLGLLAEVFSERLRVRVREETGQSYSPYAYHRASNTFAGYGYFAAHIETNPQTVATMVRIAREIAADLHAGNLTEDEFERAKKPRGPALSEYVRRNPYWLGQVLARSQTEPWRLDWARTMLADNAAITRAELVELARAFLDPDQALAVEIAPVTKSAAP